MEIFEGKPHNQPKDRRKLGTLIALGLIGMAYVADYLSERRRRTPIWALRSNPSLPLDCDRIARIYTNPVMKLLAGGIVSHHSDWLPINDRNEYSQNWFIPKSDQFYTRFGDKELGILDHARAHLATGVQEALVLGLDQEKLAEQGQNPEGYHYAFQVEGQTKISRSRIVIPSTEQVRILLSTKPLRVLTLDNDNQELPLKVEGPFNRNNPGVKHLRQF